MSNEAAVGQEAGTANGNNETLLANAKDNTGSADNKTSEQSQQKINANDKVVNQETKPTETKVQEYIDFKLPEGMVLDKEITGEFKTLAKELNLNQEAAQKLVDLQSKFVKQSADAAQSQFNQIKEDWKTQTRKAVGQEFDKEMGYAARVRDRFGSPEFNQFLEETGMGNHPGLASLLIKIGKAISEDNVESGRGAPEKKSDAQLFYPNMNKK